MADSLSVSALYYEAVDMVEVMTTLVDSSGNPLSPKDIKSVEVQLIGKTALLMEAKGLTRHYACKDLFFYVRFSHPPSTTGLRVRVSIVKTDDTDYNTVKSVLLSPRSDIDTGLFGDNAPNQFDGA